MSPTGGAVLKAVHSLSVAYLVTSGCQRPMLDQIAELERRRVRVHVMALNGRTGRVLAQPLTPGRSVDPRKRQPIASPWLERTAAWIAREAARHQVTHLHACASLRAAAAGGEAARRGGFGFSYMAGSDHEWMTRRSVERYLANARFIGVPSPADAAALARVNGALATRAHVLPPGIDLRPLVFQRIRPEPTGRVLAYITTPTLGAARELVDILPLLDTETHRVRVAVMAPSIGVATIRRLDAARDGERRVIPLEPAPSGDLQVSAANYDLVLWLDGHGAHDAARTGVLQAMAIGVPVVHVTTAPRNIVEDGHSGFVVAYDSRDGLVKTIRTALWNDVMRRRIARAARRRVEREYNMLVACAQLRRLFAESALARGEHSATERRSPRAGIMHAPVRYEAAERKPSDGH